MLTAAAERASSGGQREGRVGVCVGAVRGPGAPAERSRWLLLPLSAAEP